MAYEVRISDCSADVSSSDLEVDRLIDVFLEDTPRLITALENGAAGTPDYPALRDAAHSLKSSSASLGAMSLSAAAKRIEMGARQQSLERPAVAVALVANEFHRVPQPLPDTGSASGREKGGP